MNPPLNTDRWRDVFEAVDGWVSSRMDMALRVLDAAQRRLGVDGHVAEIGVHHGKFFLLIDCLRGADRYSFAFDLFSEQSLNLDQSGGVGTPVEEMFRDNLARFCPDHRDAVVITKCDSLSLAPSRLSAIIGDLGVRFFSVDGGHTLRHVINDLTLAEEVLSPGGIIALDDAFSPHWPGVLEGFFEFMRFRNRRLAPFLYFDNKLFITTYSEARQMLEATKSGFESQIADEFQRDLWRNVEICGFPVISRA